MSILEELELYYDSEDYLYEMANLSGNSTGLPLSLFFSPQPPNHKIRPIRFKVSDNPQKFIPSDSIVYSIVENELGEPIDIAPLTDKSLSHKHERVLAMYVILYYTPIKYYWEMKVDTKSFVNDMKHIDNEEENDTNVNE